MVITPWLGTLWGASDADPSPETEPHSRPTSLSALCLRGMVGGGRNRDARSGHDDRAGRIAHARFGVIAHPDALVYPFSTQALWACPEDRYSPLVSCVVY